MDLLLALVLPAVEAARNVMQEAAAGGGITDDGMKFLAAGAVMGIGAIGPLSPSVTLSARLSTPLAATRRRSPLSRPT